MNEENKKTQEIETDEITNDFIEETTEEKEKSNKKVNFFKKIGLGKSLALGGVLIFTVLAAIMILFSNKTNTNNNVTKSTQTQKLLKRENNKTQETTSPYKEDIEINKNPQITSQITNQNIGQKLQQLERTVKNLEFLLKEKRNIENLKKEFYMQSLIQLSQILLPNNTIEINDNTVVSFEQKGNKAFTIVYNRLTKEKKVIKNVVPLYIENGVLLKNKNTRELILILLNKEDEPIKGFLIGIDGLREITNKADLRRYYSFFQKKIENFSYNRFKNSLVLVNNFLNIVEVYEIQKRTTKETYLIKNYNILNTYLATGWIDKYLNEYIYNPKLGTLYKNQNVFLSSVTDLKLLKLQNKKTKLIVYKIAVYKNNNLYMLVDDFIKVYLSYFEFKGTIFKVKNGYLYKVDKNGNLIPFLKNGIIIATFKNHQLIRISFGVLKKQGNVLNANVLNKNNFQNLKLIGKNGEVFYIKDGFLFNEKTGAKYKLSDLSLIDNTLIDNKTLKKVLEIEKVQTLQKYGMLIETPTYKIKIFQNEIKGPFIKIENSQAKKILLSGPLNNFLIIMDKGKIAIYRKLNNIIDQKNKVLKVDGKVIPFAYIKKTKDKIYFYDAQGNIVYKMNYKGNLELILDEPILKIKILKGDVFYLETEANNADKVYIKTNLSNIKSSLFLQNKELKNDLTSKNFNEFINFIFRKKRAKLTVETVKQNQNIIKINRTSTILVLSDLWNKISLFNKLYFVLNDNSKISFISSNMFVLHNFNDGKNYTFNFTNATINVAKQIILVTFKTLNEVQQSILKKLQLLPINTSVYENVTISIPYKYIQLGLKAFFTKDNKYLYLTTINKNTNQEQEEAYIIEFSKSRFMFSNAYKVIDYNIYLDRAIISFMTRKKIIQINLNNIQPLEKESAINNYIQLLKQFLKKQEEEKKIITTPKNKEIEIKLDLEAKQLKEQIQNLKSSLKENTIQPIVLEADKKTLNKYNEQAKKREQETFSFDLGMKFDYFIPNSVEIIEGKDTYTLANLRTLAFTDMEGHTLELTNSTLLVKAKGDFSTRKVYFYPVKIIFVNKYGVKQTINIPEDATIPIYKEKDGNLVYYSKGVPAYYVNRKLKNLGSLTILSAISAMLKATSQQNNPTSAITNALDPQAQIQQQATDSVKQTVAGGVDELINFVKTNQDKLKNLLITDPNLNLSSKFIKEVKIVIKRPEEK